MSDQTTVSNSWIETYTGKKFYPFYPNAEDIDIQDIAHSLSMQCRFNGHTRYFYSVAEHSFLIANYLENQGASHQLCLAGLLHDAAEAYLGDVVRPVKQLVPALVEAENHLQATIYQKYGITVENLALIDLLDTRILRDEHEQVMNINNNEWATDRYQRLGVQIVGYRSKYVEELFLSCFKRYYNG
jgi:hypothetical protein